MSKMKQVLGLLIVACCLAACATTQTKQQRAEAAQEAARRMSDSIDNRTFTIEFTHVVPQRFTPRFLTTVYAVRVHGDTIVSYLPFFGRSHRADMYNRDRSPLDFVGTIKNYRVEQAKKDRIRIEIETRRDMEVLVYHLELYGNGNAALNVVSTDRDPIAFSGNFKTDD